MENKNIRRRDKVSAVVNILVIFAVCTSVCLFFFFRNKDIDLGSRKSLIVKKAERQQVLRREQGNCLTQCDTLFGRIERFEPGVNASFEENDIKFLLNDLKEVYERNAWDKRYKVFYHVAACYEMWFADKKVLWSKKVNIRNFIQDLEKCEIGLTQKEEKLKSKENGR